MKSEGIQRDEKHEIPEKYSQVVKNVFEDLKTSEKVSHTYKGERKNESLNASSKETRVKSKLLHRSHEWNDQWNQSQELDTQKPSKKRNVKEVIHYRLWSL